MLSFDCNSCGEDSPMALEDTVIYVYDEVQFNHFETRCEHCGAESYLFFTEASFLMHGYPIVHQPEAPWPVKHIWAQLFDPDNLPEDRRTADEEMDAVVERRFHDWLEHIQPGDFDVYP